MKSILFVIIALIIVQCDSKESGQDKVKSSYKIDKYNFIVGENLDPNKWKCDNINEDIICVPNEWKSIESDKVAAFYQIENNENTFLALLKYDTSEINIDNYLKEVVVQLKEDDNELLDSIMIQKLNYDNKILYQGIFVTNNDNNKYITYSAIFEYKSFIYDITLKCLYGEKLHYSEMFKYVLLNFKPNRIMFIKPSDILKEIIIIDDNRIDGGSN